MSEPPEREKEDPQDPAAGADLEELLERFRETEEAPRKRANPLWLISAILLSVLAGWLALRASGGGLKEKPESAALAGPMLPGKTSERLPRDEGPVDVVEDYLARCKKGMTAREVRWIVEDFQRAGLDAEIWTATPQEYAALRRAQHSWYLDLLAEGLVLSVDQRLNASAKLDALLSEAAERFGEELAEKASGVIEHNGKSFRIVESGPINRLITAERWLADERFAPWELCSLTPEQEAVTRRSELENEGLQKEEVQADREDPSATTWLDQGTAFRSSLLSKREIHVADGDFGHLAAAGHIFPLEESQLFQGEEFLRINDPTRLHPAQLKMLLLLEPKHAAGILQALEKVGE